MFSLYSVNGRTFAGSLDQWRQVARVSAASRVAGLRPVGSPDEREAEAPGADSAAIAAYAQAQQGPHGRQPLSTVQQIMRADVLSVSDQMPLAAAAQFLEEHAIGQAPVMNDAGVPVGLLLRAPLLQSLCMVTGRGQGLDAREWARRPVASCMHTPVPCVTADTDVRALAELLRDCQLPGVPVVDDAGRLAGFVSRGDIVRAVAADPPLELWA